MRLHARTGGRRVRLVALPLVVLCTCGESSERPPNVLLVSLDSTRHDLLSCYGRVPRHAPSRPTSPNIDRLAGEGVRFARAYATSSWTLPSHVALMTGQPDLVHGVEFDELSLHESRPLLAELLHGNGYRTAGFYSGPYLSPTYGFGRGFERYEACYGDALAAALEAQERATAALENVDRSDRARMDEALARANEAAARAEALSHQDVSSLGVTDAVLDELAAAREDSRPWFVFAHYFDPHYDYVPPAPHDGRFDPEYGGAVDGRDFLSNPAVSVTDPQPNRPKHRRRTISDRDLEHVLALYEGELEWTDRQVGRILDDLRAHGELDDTVVVVLSDHGDEFFEHGNIGHRRTLFEEVLRVPLVLRYPAGLPAGITSDAVASIHDVPATVLELVGIDAPDGLLSRSLVPLARDDAPASEGRAIGRLVDPLLVPTEHGMGQRLRIQEVFVRWPIKIRRMREWVDPTPVTPPGGRDALLEEADADRAEDVLLAWIDLEECPEERLDQYSADFGHPAARAALEEFQSVYRAMAELRLEPRQAGPGGPSEDLLRGLGYGGSEAPDASVLPFDRLLLPPPGD